MAIKIPNKAFLSFSYKQCVDTLYRAASQIESSWSKESQRLDALAHLKGNIETILAHEETQIQDLAKSILEKFPKEEKEMSFWVMDLERLAKKDLRDSDFLVSTIDDFDKSDLKKLPIHLVLDNLRSSFNVGSLFRTAEALGVSKIHLCGYTATPDNSKTAKSALGTDNWVEWKYWESTAECLNFLKSTGFKTYAFETEATALTLEEVPIDSAVALILGNEKYGLSAPILKQADYITKISLIGKKNSLNVSICGAIAMNHFSQKLK
jgi:tRNA G18 (ribose-2'-O)-methylase SpoU